jgi:RNA polymerase sigma factor for flagellar operon FliA
MTTDLDTLRRFENFLPELERALPRFTRECGPTLARDEVRAIGLSVGYRAALTFDPSRGVPFGAWATLKIRGALRDAMRSERRRRRIAAAWEHAHRVSPGAELNHGAIDRRAGMGVDEIARVCARLPVREYALVRAHYFHGEPLDAAGRRLGISKSWASRLHQRALQQLRRHLEGRPFSSESACGMRAPCETDGR